MTLARELYGNLGNKDLECQTTEKNSKLLSTCYRNSFQAYVSQSVGRHLKTHASKQMYYLVTPLKTLSFLISTPKSSVPIFVPFSRRRTFFLPSPAQILCLRIILEQSWKSPKWFYSNNLTLQRETESEWYSLIRPMFPPPPPTPPSHKAATYPVVKHSSPNQPLTTEEVTEFLPYCSCFLFVPFYPFNVRKAI